MLSALVADPPIELTREQAAQLARAELADPAYHSQQPLLQRLLQWALEHLLTLLDRIGAASPGGWLGLLGLAVLLVAVVTVVRWRIGPVARRGAGPALFDLGAASVTAAEHRRRAVLAAGDGAYADAVRERLRAIVCELEERGLLDPAPGRTADEAARAAGAVLPDLSGRLRDGALRFDQIWYGRRAALAEDDALLTALDDAVRTAPVPSRRSSAAAGSPAVPR